MRISGGNSALIAATSLSASDARVRMENAMRATAARPLFSAEEVLQIPHRCMQLSDGQYSQQSLEEILPHVYTSNLHAQRNILSHTGSTYMLPLGTTHEHYEV